MRGWRWRACSPSDALEAGDGPAARAAVTDDIMQAADSLARRLARRAGTVATSGTRKKGSST